MTLGRSIPVKWTHTHPTPDGEWQLRHCFQLLGEIPSGLHVYGDTFWFLAAPFLDRGKWSYVAYDRDGKRIGEFSEELFWSVIFPLQRGRVEQGPPDVCAMKSGPEGPPSVEPACPA